MIFASVCLKANSISEIMGILFFLIFRIKILSFGIPGLLIIS